MSDTGYNATKWAFIYDILTKKTKYFVTYINPNIKYSLYIVGVRKHTSKNNDNNGIIPIQPIESDYSVVSIDTFNNFITHKKKELAHKFNDKRYTFTAPAWEGGNPSKFKKRLNKLKEEFSIAEAIRSFSPKAEERKIFVSRAIPDKQYNIYICISIDKAHFIDFQLESRINFFPFGDTKTISFLESTFEIYISRITNKQRVGIDYLNDPIWKEHKNRIDLHNHQLYRVDGQSFDDILIQGATDFMNDIVFFLMRNRPNEELIFPTDDLRRQKNLYQTCVEIAKLTYEHQECTGKLVFYSDSTSYLLKLKKEFKIGLVKMTRKLLEITNEKRCLVANPFFIQGISSFDNFDNIFHISFVGRNHWHLFFGKEKLLNVKDGIPISTNAAHQITEAVIHYRMIFSDNVDDIESKEKALYKTIEDVLKQKHGLTLVISKIARDEVERLSNDAFSIDPIPLYSPDYLELFSSLSKIDGAVIVDESLNCYGVGVILDGILSKDSDLSRGARYNSALRYLESSSQATLIIVISVDGTIDILPNWIK